MDGCLSLRFDASGDRTVLRVVRQDPPWKVVRGFTTATGECLVHLNNVSGGILGGDRLELQVDVASGAQAQVTTTGATRLYAPRSGSADSLCSTRVHLQRGALLEYLPDPLIPFRGARAEQTTHITMEEGATLFWWETIAPGRAGSAECFEYERVHIIAEVWTGAMPILIDRMQLEPKTRGLASPARFGGYQFLTTFVIVSPGTPSSVWRELQGQIQIDGLGWGVSVLPAHGLIVRLLSDSGLPIMPALLSVWRSAKLLLCGRPVTPPRKTY